MQRLRIVFDGPPGPESGRFVEVETAEGTSVKFGEWEEGKDGYWYLNFFDYSNAQTIIKAKDDECDGLREERNRIENKLRYYEQETVYFPPLEKYVALKSGDTVKAISPERVCDIINERDAQEVGKEIGVTLGMTIRPEILPYIKRLKAELAEARKALELVLPMAKGFLVGHDVGSNRAYINIAETTLAGKEKEDE
jgi:hypothetical protein